MALSPTSSEGGGNTTAQVVASGKVIPVAAPTGVTVDTTTYDNPAAAGKITALVFPAETTGFGFAQTGDTNVRVALGTEQDDGLMLGPGNAATDCTVRRISNARLQLGALASDIKIGDADTNVGTFNSSSSPLLIYAGTIQLRSAAPVIGGNEGDIYIRLDSATLIMYRCATAGIAGAAVWTPVLVPGSPTGIITAGALPTLTITSGTGRQILTTRDAETITPFTGDGTNNAATCAIALSPDDTTYSTMATISIAAALNLTGVLTDTVNCRVPAGWYIRLTASHGTIGTTTYY